MAQRCVLHLFFNQKYFALVSTWLKKYFTGGTSLKKGWEPLLYGTPVEVAENPGIHVEPL